MGGFAAAALFLFAGGEAWKWLSADSGRWFLLRTLRVGSRADATRLVGDRVRKGLLQAHVPRDSVHESVAAAGAARVRWHIGVPRDGSPTQVNFSVSRLLEQAGGEVFSADERTLAGGGQRVTLRVGLGGRTTHELVVTRAGRDLLREESSTAQRAAAEGRIAIVLYGFDDESGDLALRVARRPEVFGLALPMGRRTSPRLLRAAHAAGRELVLQVPMEPENYPRVNPGPGALLVSMPAGRIASLTRRYLDDGDGAIAITNLMGSFATQDEPLMTSVYRELRKAGTTFVELAPGPRSLARSLASQMGVAYDVPDVILDGEATAKDDRSLDRAWNTALEQAVADGHRLVWLRATDRSLAWLDRALSPKRLGGVALVPPSRVLRRPGTL